MRPSMQKGAVPYKKGYLFTVWAPHADDVFVIGSFNNWDKTAHPLDREADGCWSGYIANVKPGDEYRYRILNGDNEYLRIDPYARRVTNSVGNSIIVKPYQQGAQFNPPALNEMVIYELHIGTFGKQGNEDEPGDLKGAIERLSYLKELGINVVEIMPLAEFSGGFSWGYNPSHIFAVESHYGGPADFIEFVDAAHQLGIAVIVDVVYNHFGPSDLDLWQFDGWSENGKGGIYFYNDCRATTPWGETRPDYGRKEVREFIRDNALMWFQEFGVDGLRWDMTTFIRNVHGHDHEPKNDLPDGWSLMQWVNDEIQQHSPQALNIAEDLQQNLYLTKETKHGGAGFQAQWAAPFVHAVRAVLIGPDDAARDMDAVRNAIVHRYYLNAFERVIYTESHDEVSNGKARIAEEVAPGNASSWAAKKKSALGAVLVFTAPGIPMIFQGQEFLEDDWFHDQDPIDWSKKDRFAGILQLYKDLITLRLNRDGNTKGLTGQEVSVYHLNHQDNMIAYHRWDLAGPHDSVVIVANFSSRAYIEYKLPFPAAGKWTVLFNSDSKYYDVEFGNFGNAVVYAEHCDHGSLPAAATISIGPYSALILAQTR